MKSKKYRYNHLGIPTTEVYGEEQYWPEFDMHTYGYEENPFNMEWMRFGPKCKLPEIVKKCPHICFEVDDVYKAIEGYEVIIQPNSPAEGITVAFVLVNNAPVEFIHFEKKQKCKKRKTK